VNTLAIVGCGYVGEQACAQALARGRAVRASSRDAAKVARLAGEGIAAVQLEPTDEAAVAAFLRGADILLHSIPPDAAGDVTPTLVRAAEFAGVRACVYIGSTGVYAADAGDVDDDTVVAPTPRGQSRLAAERVLREAASRGSLSVGILRVPAIYGPGRGVHMRLREGGFFVPGEGNNFVSRIHVEDLVAVALALGDALAAATPGTVRVHVVGDALPTTLREHADGVAEMLGLPPPPSVPAERAPETLRGNRRVNGARVLGELGLQLRHPTWREGLAACLAVEAAAPPSQRRL